MYRLTPRMVQRLERDLRKYHDLFDGGRCSGWELEELIVTAIKADTQAQHQVRWKEAGHDDEADVVIRTNGSTHPVQIKSGKIQAGRLMLSGHRLGRFAGDFTEICDYLNRPSANIVAVPYRRDDGEQGRRHIYHICYVGMEVLTGLEAPEWERRGTQYVQSNRYGVEFSLRPSMSWQIWWSIPREQQHATDEIVIS